MQWLELIGGLVVAAALVLGVMRYFSVTARNAAARDELLNRWYDSNSTQRSKPPEKDTSSNATK